MKPRRQDPTDTIIAALREDIGDIWTHYLDLFHLIPADASTGRRDAGPGPRGKKPDAKLPISVDVLDLLARIETESLELEEWAAIRVLATTPPRRPDPRDHSLGYMPDDRVRQRLTYVAGTIPTIVARDYGTVLGQSIGPLLTKCRRYLDIGDRVHRLETTCPYCAMAALVLVYRETNHSNGTSTVEPFVRCGNPACRDDAGRPHTWKATDYLGQFTTDQEAAS